MTTDAILVTVISSLISGIGGVGLSIWCFYKLERHKLKLDLARRLLGNRYDVCGEAFSCAINEVIVVFADSEDVLSKMANFYEILKKQDKSRTDDALIDLLNSVCKASRLAQATLNDNYFLKVFNARN